MSPWKKILICVIAGIWLLAMLAALWRFQSRYIRPFDERAVVFDGTSLRLPEALLGSRRINLVHFWDPACPCNAGNQAHLAELMTRYGNLGVDFHAVQKPGSSGRLPDNLANLQPLTTLPGSGQLPSSPAVAIWDRDGQLAYFGPYSAGLTCNSSNSFIEPVLEAVLAGRTVRNTNALAVGCFCEWTTSVGPTQPEQPEQP